MPSLLRALRSGRPRHTDGVAPSEKAIREALGDSSDIVYRRFTLGGSAALLVFIDGLVDKRSLEDAVLRASARAERGHGKGMEGASRLWASDVKEVGSLSEGLGLLSMGSALLIVDGWPTAAAIQVTGPEHRPVGEPQSEKLIRGPRDGFTEVLRVNTALVRRRIKDPGLRVTSATVGRRTVTSLAVIHIEGLTDSAIVAEVMERIGAIDVDGIQDSGELQEYLTERPWTPFPLLQYTERPDLVARALLNGRVAILMDTSPGALVVPTTLNQLMISPEDYYHIYLTAILVRSVRVTASMMALALPAFYIGVSAFSPELLPYPLLITAVSARVDLPFPLIAEVFLMETALELLRESSVHMPGTQGQVIGVVGGLIVGQAAVTAGLVSPLIVVLVALTAIGGFAVPSFDLGFAFRIMRFGLMLAASVFGLYGWTVGLLAILVHVCTLDSFGVSYLTPWAPYSRDLVDSVARPPLPDMPLRPDEYGARDMTRMATRGGITR